MVYIKVQQGESFDQALKRFLRELKNSKIQEEVMKRRFHTKRAEIRRQRRKERDLKIKLANKYRN